MVRLLPIVLVVLFLWTSSYAQRDQNEQLAQQFFDQQQYGKAVVYYQKLYNKTGYQAFYDRLLVCYVQQNELKSAEKLVKKQIKRLPEQLTFQVDLGYVYLKANEPDKSEQIFNKVIKQLPAERNSIIEVANQFIAYDEIDMAIKTYLRGRKISQGNNHFGFELAPLYERVGNVEEMLATYVFILEQPEPMYMSSVQNALQTVLSEDEGNKKKKLLKSILLRKIQQRPNNYVYPEMLIWLYVQEKNFEGAFIQAKAIDRRFKEKGDRIMNLASLSASNKDYTTAIKCYEYLISKGAEHVYYSSSKVELVDVYNKKIVEANDFTNQDLNDLKDLYVSTIAELGNNTTTASLMIGLGTLEGFYLHQIDTAVAILQRVLAIPRLKQSDLAKGKLALGDVYLVSGEIWEASLLYSQVEKSFKYDQLGETAKFNNAKISFYTGDFGWAKAQLDILKASTSKLIANDAMRLSILITDNGVDEEMQEPLLMYAKADLLAYQNKTTEAFSFLDSIALAYPDHSILDEVLYKKYQINYKHQEYERAAENLERILQYYNSDILADDALYDLANLYHDKLNNKEKARELYKQLLFDYQGSIHVVDARKKYRAITK